MTTTESPAQEPLSGGPAMPARDPSLKEFDVFVAGVRQLLRDDPAAQQALRRGLAKRVSEMPTRTHAALLRGGLIPDGAKSRRSHYAIAALIAVKPRARRVEEEEAGASTHEADAKATTSDTPPVTTAGFRPYGTNLGESLALAVSGQGPAGLKEGSTESRLHLLVRQDEDAIHRMLPGVLRQLGSTGVPIDYACLLKDLTAWRFYRDSVTTRWLESYYRVMLREKEKAKKAAALTD